MNLFNELQSFLPLLLKGTLTTLFLWVSCSAISLSVGLVLGILQCNKVRTPYTGWILDSIVTILQGIPLYTQLLLAYFVILPYAHISLSAITTGIWVLGLCSSAYSAQIIRSALNSLPNEQWQTGHVLGYSLYQQLRFVALPQVMSTAIGGLANEATQILKSTAVLAAIGTVELTKVGINIVSSSLNPLAVFISIALIYLGLTLLWTLCWRKLERYSQW